MSHTTKGKTYTKAVMKVNANDDELKLMKLVYGPKRWWHRHTLRKIIDLMIKIKNEKGNKVYR
jgi:hypothetical protein